jgi:capsular polysaccharide transport system permease protein
MTLQRYPAPPVGTIARGLAAQFRVIGALILRELHTRYGRENIGYLWVIGEPLVLATMIMLLHSGEKTHYAGEIPPVAFAVMGYTIFIMFRGIFNRADGALEGNVTLLYHRMVTIFDLMLARALIEAAGTFLAYVILISLLISLGYADPPERPLYLLLGIVLMFWLSFALSLIVASMTHENRLLARFVHPISYILMPLSGAFYRVQWVPNPYREYLMWIPLPQIFEMCRYGQFAAAEDDYFYIGYMVGCCACLTYIGLVAVKLVRNKVHLN